jgi:hypothetical protein
LWPQKKVDQEFQINPQKTQCIWCDYILHAVLFNLKLSCLTFRWIFHTCLCLLLGNIFPSFLPYLHKDRHTHKTTQNMTSKFSTLQNFTKVTDKLFILFILTQSSLPSMPDKNKTKKNIERKYLDYLYDSKCFFGIKFSPLQNFFYFFFNWIFNLCTSSEK